MLGCYNQVRCLKIIHQHSKHLDAMFVRAPSPLAPYFQNYIIKIPIIYLIVGDYAESSEHLESSWWKKWIIKHFLLQNDKDLLRATKKVWFLLTVAFYIRNSEKDRVKF